MLNKINIEPERVHGGEGVGIGGGGDEKNL